MVMKILSQGSGLFPLLLTALLLTGSGAMAAPGSVLERIDTAGEPFAQQKIESAHQLTGKTVVAKESYQGGEFRVLARKEFIKRYRCGVCHTAKPMAAREAGAFTHGDISSNHGRQGAELLCGECHHEKERDFLVDSQGRKIDFDHSYQLCGKCHFRQKRDWVGGAHGKRVTYWAGARVVQNCAGCHDPHAPAFPAKMPATYSLPLAE
jgi:hypothetical protein